VAGGLSDADSVAVGGAGILGGQGGAGTALGGWFGGGIWGLGDAGADLGSFQGGFADGAEDNIFNSVTTINIS
jgi:hypothetical protein